MRGSPVAAFVLVSAVACAGAETARLPVAAAPAPRPPPPQAPAATPECELPTQARRRVLSAALTSPADLLVVLRDNGCLEVWDLAQRARVATAAASPGVRSVAIASGPVVLTGGEDAYALPSLEHVEAPKTAAPRVARDGDAVGILDLDPALTAALTTWAARSRATLRREDTRTWIAPKLGTNEVRELDLTADGRLLADDDELRRLDTGKHARFPAWTKGFTAMSGEPLDGMTHLSLGPRSDRAVVLSIARMGAGPEVGEAWLIDTTTMKRIATLATSCQPHDVVWSPRGAWIVREPCEGGVLADKGIAVDADTGRVLRELPSRAIAFSADDHTVVSGATVLDLATGERRFTLPSPAVP